MKIIVLFFALILGIGCSSKTHSNFYKSQSELISEYRSQDFFEYGSRLNDSMMLVLDGDKNNLISNATYYKIIQTSKRVKKEKLTLGCYLIDWNDNPYDTTSKIILDWNLSEDIIIRFFTTSEEIMNKLPNQSF